MSIKVTCPGCLARFKVSSRFAGQSGPCPKCGAMIRVPSPDDTVEIHAPKPFASGGRGAGGKLILRPIARESLKLSVRVAVALVAGILAVAAGAWLGGGLLRHYWVVRAVALLVVSGPVVWAGYFFVRHDESLDRFASKPLAIRTAICATAYAALWGVFGYVATFGFSGEVWSWLVVAPPFVVTGGLVALACYDLDFGGGCLHYGFYLLVTILLRGLAGMGWIWELGRME